MWKGVLQGYMMHTEKEEREAEREEARRIREEDMALRREQFERQRLDAYRTAILPVLLDRQEEARAEQRAINGLVTLGFSRPSANALYMTGEAPQLLEALKAQDYAPSVISAYDQQTVSILRDRAEDGDTRAAALLNGVYSGANLANPSEATAAIIEAAFQATNFEDIQSMALRIDPERIDSMAPLGLSFSTADVGIEVTRRLRREITESIGPLFGPDAIREDNGEIIINEASAPGLSLLITRTLRAAESDLNNPVAGRNLTERDVLAKYTTPFLDLRDAEPTATPEDFIPYLPTLAEQGPQVFVETFQQNFVPRQTGSQVETTGDTIGLMTGRGRQAGGVRPPEVTIPEVDPVTGFDPNVFDPENLQ